VTVGGIVASLRPMVTKRGDQMAVFVLEDLGSAIEVMVFPKTHTEHGHKLADDTVVCVKGRVDKREDEPKLVAMEVDVIDGIGDGAPPVRVRITEHAVHEGVVSRLKTLLSEHPGESQVFLHIGDRHVLRLPDEFCVDASNGLVGELRVLLGADAVVL